MWGTALTSALKSDGKKIAKPIFSLLRNPYSGLAPDFFIFLGNFPGQNFSTQRPNDHKKKENLPQSKNGTDAPGKDGNSKSIDLGIENPRLPSSLFEGDRASPSGIL